MGQCGTEVKFRNLQQIFKYTNNFMISINFFHSITDGRGQRNLEHCIFFSSINIDGENEDKALHIHTVRYSERGQL